MSSVQQTPARVILVGAGERGGRYADWIAAHPDRIQLVAVAEPRERQRNGLAKIHGISPELARGSWQELAARERFADGVIIATLDADHLAPAKAFAEQGYHLLVEKPLAPTEAECVQLVAAVQKAGVMFAVGHVLRYTPYTKALKRVLDSGRIGKIVSVEHLEPVGFEHYAHSYVRGNWRNTAESSFMLLAKSCHDIDWLRYVVGSPITTVSSFGSLSHFRRDQAPAGAADRCLDCSVEQTCPYSAKRIYQNSFTDGLPRWPLTIITSDFTEAGITEALRSGPYGRCVYACDNDVVDHQVVACAFENGVTATFTMTGLTGPGDRRTRIFGTHGEIDINGERIRIVDFRNGEVETRDTNPGHSRTGPGSGHLGGDGGLIDAFTRALETGDSAHIATGAAETLESHLAVFAAERARLNRTVEPVTVPQLSSAN